MWEWSFPELGEEGRGRGDAERSEWANGRRGDAEISVLIGPSESMSRVSVLTAQRVAPSPFSPPRLPASPRRAFT